MCNSSSIFNSCLRSGLLWILVLGSCLNGACHASEENEFYDVYRILPMDTKGKEESRWVDYLIAQLNRRAGNTIIASGFKPMKGSFLTLKVGVDSTLKFDYRIARNKGSLELSARNGEILLWLLYQFIENVGSTDPRIAVGDLPPAIISMENTETSFDFSHRGLYTPSNSDPEFMSIVGTSNMDYDWGIWGHNLGKIIRHKETTTLYAWQNGKRNVEQFCFSSATLFEEIDSYILNNYGKGALGDPTHFLIMPNDNDLVCLCQRCVAVGNTAKNATPAVTALIEKLAQQYPNHRFFTSAYRTTSTVPLGPLSENVGVVISAMNFPLQPPTAEAEKEGMRFKGQIEDWRALTPIVYIWDYMRNFDDYLTPYPCIEILQKRLQLFKEWGVQGLLFNGSGEDFAAFDDVQSYLIASLLMNTQLDTDELQLRYLEHFYPHTASVLHAYISQLEDRAYSHGKALPFYGGIGEAKSLYLEPTTFESFFLQMDSLSKTAAPEERKRLNLLLTGLSFTRAELRRLPDCALKPDSGTILETLKGYTAFSSLNNYRESYGALADYILLRESTPIRNREDGNLLAGKQLQMTNATANNLEDLSALTDSYYGLASDYHTNWYISKVDTLAILLPDSLPGGKYRCRIGLLDAPCWRIYLPDRIEMWQGERLLEAVTPFFVLQSGTPFGRIMVLLTGSLSSENIPIQLRFYIPDRPRATIAIDEIELYPQKIEQ